MAYAPDDVIQGQPAWSAMGFPSRDAYVAVYGQTGNGPVGASWGAPTGRDILYRPGGAAGTAPAGAPAAPAPAPNAPTTQAPVTPPDPAALAQQQQQQSGIAILQAALDRYGLPASMLDFAKGEITGGASPDQVLLDLYQRPEFAARFPGIIARQKAGLAPMSPEEAIQFEGHLHQTAQAYGLPSDFGSRETAQHLIGQDVSVAEADKRIVDGFAEVTKMPPEVRQHFGQYFGANTDAALAAHVLDPTLALPDLDRQVRAAEIGGSADIHGYDIDRGRAEEIARTGVTFSTAQTAFAHLNQLQPLFQASVSESRDLSAEREGVGAEFQLDSTSAQQIQRRLDERSAAFKGGGGAEESGMGVVGSGTRPG